MAELIKRLLTSIILILLLLISISNTFVLCIVLIACFYQIIVEFHSLLGRNFKKHEKTKLYLLTILLIIYIGYFNIKIFITFLNNNSSELLLLYFIIITCISTDIGGYIFGKIFKGPKLTKISPKKTYSGMIGSYFFSLLFVVIIFDGYMNVEKLFFLIIITSTVSQIGDIFISFLKRKSKLKDASSLLPGHGGLLDRFDGLIFAIPISSIFFNII